MFQFQYILTLTFGCFPASGVLCCSILDSLSCLQVSRPSLQSMGLSGLCNSRCQTNSDCWSRVKSESYMNFTFCLFCSSFQSWFDIIKDSVCEWIATLALHIWALLCFFCFCFFSLCITDVFHFYVMSSISLWLAFSTWASSTRINCKLLQTLSASGPAAISVFPVFFSYGNHGLKKQNESLLFKAIYIYLSRNFNIIWYFKCFIRDQILLQRSIVFMVHIIFWSFHY